MRRLEIMCRTAVNWAPVWGADWAVEHVRIALLGDGDSTTWERGRRINHRASLGARVVELREQIRRVIRRLGDPSALQAELAAIEPEWRRLLSVEGSSPPSSEERGEKR